MNYLTNYYKNLCEQLQEKVNLLEAQIYGAELKFVKGEEQPALTRIFSPTIQGGKREVDLKMLRRALEDPNHPIHSNPGDVSAVKRVIADAERIVTKKPRDPLAWEAAQHAVGEKKSPAAVESQKQFVEALRKKGTPEKDLPKEDSMPSFGWALDRPESGRATIQHMRTAVEVMTGRYGRNTPTTGSQPY